MNTLMLLEAINVKLSVKDRLLWDISRLQINKDDRIGLVGKNGSGKSTLLEALAGKQKPDEGTFHRHTTYEWLPQWKRLDTTKSGGELTQEYIIQLLSKNVELLFLDEPTTHLDTKHIEWLEQQLTKWQGAFVIVSHDRSFLDALCTTIWELDEAQVSIYKGNYTDYMEQKERKRKQRKEEYETYVQKKKQLENALRLKEQKAEKATKTPKKVNTKEAKKTKPYFAKKQKKLQKSVQAMETRLEKLEKVEKIKDHAPIKMQLPNVDLLKNRIMVRVEDASAFIGEKILWKQISFTVRGGDKIAVVGPNGCGKTTLIKKIMQKEKGITISPAVKLGYFSQDLSVLDSEKTIIENVRDTSIQDETLIRTILARLHFYNEDVQKQVKVLSGGERVKVALAKLMVSDSNTLILDEPTNYLDIETVEVLEDLLKQYEGTIIFVTHDRRLIANVATRIATIEAGKLTISEGTNGVKLLTKPSPNETNGMEANRLLLETKITEVLSQLSINPSEQLEQEFQRLLSQKREIEKKKK